MFDSPEELLQKIHLGEDTSLELKTVRFRGNRVTEPRRDGGQVYGFLFLPLSIDHLITRGEAYVWVCPDESLS